MDLTIIIYRAPVTFESSISSLNTFHSQQDVHTEVAVLSEDLQVNENLKPLDST